MSVLRHWLVYDTDGRAWAAFSRAEMEQALGDGSAVKGAFVLEADTAALPPGAIATLQRIASHEPGIDRATARQLARAALEEMGINPTASGGQ